MRDHGCMRPRSLVLLPVLLLASLAAAADDDMCGTGPENDRAVRALHERVRAQERVHTNEAPAASVRDGAIYLQADESIAPGYHPFDLGGKTLLFEPRGASSFRVTQTALDYSEPHGEVVRDFETKTGTPWYSVAHDLPFSVNLFGRDVTRIYVTAFNSIQLDEPAAEEAAMQVDDVEGALHAQAIISPLLITNRKPRFLLYPRVYITDASDAVTVTWRSTGGDPFRYDIQARIEKTGAIRFSYKSVEAVSWGAPVVSAGLQSTSLTRQVIAHRDDRENDVVASFGPAIRDMVDVRKVDVFRIDGSDVVSVRMTVAAPVDPSLLTEGQSLRYAVSLEGESQIDIDRHGNVTIVPFGGDRPVAGGASVHVDGNTIEFFGRQGEVASPVLRTASVETWVLPLNRPVDGVSVDLTLDPAPRHIASDLSSLSAARELELPIVEGFTLPPFDPFAAYAKIRGQFGINDAEVDAVAMYQTFYTDLIFYAGAYSTGGNPRVDGVSPEMYRYGSRYRRAPSLLHLNQLTYNYSAAVETASKVMLHEFGHRWLYFISIKENGASSRVLNPVSAHPAGYVHTPSAFPVYGDEESSVMGGGYFSDQGDGTYRARAANMGYSWTDLYLMGLAAPSEVAPWFYLANTNPPLAKEYWPVDGAVVSGEKRDVNVQQVIDAVGARTPSTATSERHFHVVFVLVTEPGVDPTDAQMAKINEWRALMARNFFIATGGRAGVSTTFAIPAKRRATR